VGLGERDQAERFRAIYEENYVAILGYVSRRAQRDDVDDVVAETFGVAWRRVGDIPSGEAARLWLYATARRVLANHDRAARRRGRLVARLGQLEQPDGREAADPDEKAIAAFARLAPEQREVLALSVWEELSATEIGKVLGCSPTAVRIRLLRARRALVRELQRQTQPPQVRPLSAAAAGPPNCRRVDRGADQ